MIRCNWCAVSDCNLYKNNKVANDCKMFRRLSSDKIPLLLHLLSDDRKVENTLRVLSNANIKVVEISKYPYFKLNYK